MSYFQCLLIVTTIWAAEVTTRFVFDYVAPHKMEYRTYYLSVDTDGHFKGANMERLGDEGWELVSVVPRTRDEVICFFKKGTMF